MDPSASPLNPFGVAQPLFDWRQMLAHRQQPYALPQLSPGGGGGQQQGQAQQAGASSLAQLQALAKNPKIADWLRNTFGPGQQLADLSDWGAVPDTLDFGGLDPGTGDTVNLGFGEMSGGAIWS